MHRSDIEAERADLQHAGGIASEQTEPILRALGERNDIIKGINRALAEREQERELGTIILHGQWVDTPVTGRMIDKRLSDELGDRIAVTIDGIDGQPLTLRGAATAEDAKIDSIVEVSPAHSSIRDPRAPSLPVRIKAALSRPVRKLASAIPR
jgi:type IV secretory pathway VirD2 relaxase